MGATLMHGKLQSPSAHALDLAARASSPSLVRSASAHSASLSPEPHSHSPAPSLSPSAGQTTSPVIIAQPQPDMVAQVSALAAAAPHDGSRATWPTRAMHAQLARVGSIGGLQGG